MKRLAVLSTDGNLNRKIGYYCKKVSADFSPVYLKKEKKYLEYLNYELPEICVFNFSDQKLNMDLILEAFIQDSWIHDGGIIAVHSSDDEEQLEKKLKNNNVISLIKMGGLDFSFPRVLRILHQNRQIIFQRELQSQLLNTISSSFIIDNDPFDVKTYSRIP